MATLFAPHGSLDTLYSASGKYHKLTDDSFVELESIPLTSRSDLVRGRREDHKDSYSRSVANAAPDKFVITTGWSLSLVVLLLNGIISICWGIALFIFSLGVVPISYTLSTAGRVHPNITNTVIAFVAAISTMHISYIVQQIPAHYSHCLLVDGFTLGHLRWMQGVQQISIFTRFPDRDGGGKITRFLTKKQIFWFVAYFGIAFHTSSLVAILQPEIFYKNYLFNDPVPCGHKLTNLTLSTDQSLSQEQQQMIDWYSFNVGLMLPNYGEQVNGNTTTSIAGRVYRKDNYAYGTIGGLANGLQQIPGIFFNASCSQDDPAQSTAIWKSVFPDRSLPTLVMPSNGSEQQFTDSPLPEHVQNVTSHAPPLSFDLITSQAALYALVDTSGSGALYSVSINADPSQAGILSTLVCSWKTSPQRVQVQTVEFVARTLSSSNSTRYPSLAGRATLKTLEGMAEAARLGSSLQKTALDSSTNPIVPYFLYFKKDSAIDQAGNTLASASQILEILLADGGKASMTIYNVHFSNYGEGKVRLCYSNNRTVAEHWRFSNSKQLGWVATIWTTAIGIYAVIAALWMRKRRRMQKVSVLDAPGAFSLGRDSEIRDTDILCVKNGRVVVQERTETECSM